jgi:hypothetical protein
MTDQPKHGNDGTPEGYPQPSHIPPQESAPTAPPAELSFEKPDYEQQQAYGAQSQSAEQYGQPTNPYPAAYGAPTQPPYAQPSGPPYAQQPYAAPGQPSGQPPYGQPGSPYNPYGQPAYYGLPPERKGLSIASLCCGIAAFVGLGFFILPQVAAVILGHLALMREPSGKGMAIAGLVLGYVAIALTVLVIVIISIVANSLRYSGSAA